MSPGGPRTAALSEWGLTGLMLTGLPLLGVWLAGKPVAEYAEFPPLTRYVEHAAFSWPVAGGLLALYAVALLPFLWRVWTSRGPSSPTAAHGASGNTSFPWWGWAGLLLGAVSWRLAWTRMPWFAPLQVFTFTPQWLAYILVINGLCMRRTGSCLLLARPVFFAALFPASALFWWFFEYLNRFVQNWYYVGVSGLTPASYVLYATLPFATVLPAVLSTRQWLAAWPRLTAGLDRFAPAPAVNSRRGAALTLLLAAAALAGVGVWPDLLFGALWVAPLLILTALRVLHGRPTVLAGVATGDWRHIAELAVAALICGLFWELWNVWSLAKWVYAVPFVNRFHFFEMPLLGFGGYLPFGLECGAVALMIEDLVPGGRNVPNVQLSTLIASNKSKLCLSSSSSSSSSNGPFLSLNAIENEDEDRFAEDEDD